MKAEQRNLHQQVDKLTKDKMNFLLTPQQLLELITRDSLDAFVVSDINNTVVVWSGYAEALFGWSAAEAIGAPLTRLIIPPEHHAAHEEGIRRFLETGQLKNVNKRLEVFGTHKNGHLLPLEMTVIPVQLDSQTFLLHRSAITVSATVTGNCCSNRLRCCS